jgi:predicted component of type VI protein secretion system
VEIGPVPRALFDQFLPAGARIGPPPSAPAEDVPGSRAAEPAAGGLPARVRELIDAYLRDPLEYRIKAILAPDARETPVLGGEFCRIGAGLWLGETPRGEVACKL